MLSSVAISEKNKLATDGVWYVALDIDVPGIGESTLNSGLTFHAPFDDPDNPLKLLAGTGVLTFTRAHDATHTATYLNPNTGLVTGATNNQLRIESKGALIEGARTNTDTYSAHYNVNAQPYSWQGVTPVSDSVVCPDGSSAGSKILGDAGASQIHQMLYASALSDNTVYTFSSFFKAGGQPRAQIEFYGKDADRAYIVCNLSTGAIVGSGGTMVGYGVIAYPNGWYRLWIAKDMKTGVGGQHRVVSLPNDDAGQTVFVADANTYVYGWGHQLEAGTCLSSYIPTTSGAMSRTADILSFLIAGNLVSATGGSYLESEIAVAGAVGDGRFRLCTDTAGGRFPMQYNYPPTVYDGVNSVSSDQTSVPYVTDKIACSWGGSVIKVSVNGETPHSGTFDGAMTGTTSVNIGSYGGQHHIWGHVKNVKMWGRELTSAELVALTTSNEAGMIRVVRNNENITWKGYTYTAFPFEFDEIPLDSKGEVPRLDIRISNVNRAMEAYLIAYDTYTKNNGFQPITVKMSILNSKLGGATPLALGSVSAEAEYNFELKQPKTNALWATFTLSADNPYNQRYPSSRILKNHCRFVFKSALCGYSGSETLCNKTFSRCTALANFTRFGGFVGVGRGGVPAYGR